MIPRRIEGATRYLGAPRGWEPERDGDCCHLAVMDVEMEGSPMMVSAWEPTPKELAALNCGKPVYLSIRGTGHPPVNVWVEA